MKRLTIDGKALRNQRHARGWTQEQLAIRAALSIRVVAKAEAGKSVSQSTLRALARALGGPDDVGEMYESLVLSPRNVVTLFLESFGARGVTADRQLLSKEVSIDIHSAEATLRQVSGPGEATRFLRRIAARGSWAHADVFSPARLVVEGNRAVTWGYFSVGASQRRMRRAWLIVVNFEVADAQIQRVRIDVTPTCSLRPRGSGSPGPSIPSPSRSVEGRDSAGVQL